MDKEKKDWSWLRDKMPKVIEIMADRRKEFGSEWVNECWRRGVIAREPGWFYAAEGAVAVGTMWDDPLLLSYATGKVPFTEAIVILREREASNGQN